ncbi:hypothetical protein GUITHDRAFT_104972 [Guillardia theta CCMP2712]|uniref:Uncharacterized protein n=1 Tax=Guillardia theta (strain CCMP2712) TaxID=905079 RepID=L1JMZ0_GUITC|nr:hypothetical protein GUITHDRAFT_104972 [Guillardia theta CCMP2712]EKX49443.1 hypothetical protein GUITHDRAFT_104972 [Guillardia theta CCMP2712]|eukprot:XP_005836423.1 hypothetical protein GUITHDRAFT_104972 [Guillardia theta CCMP2712]
MTMRRLLLAKLGFIRGSAHVLCCLLLFTGRVTAGQRENFTVVASLTRPEEIYLPGRVGARCEQALVNFSRPHKERWNASLEDFLSLLPAKFSSLRVGEVFPVLNETAVLDRWLRKLHPGAKHARYHPLDPQVRPEAGGYGILRAISNERMEFLFRIQAEFLLQPSPPLFAMPSRLDGTLVMDSSGQKIFFFDLSLPTVRAYNLLLECGEPFAKLGNKLDAAPSSPDARRLTVNRLILRRDAIDKEGDREDGNCELLQDSNDHVAARLNGEELPDDVEPPLMRMDDRDQAEIAASNDGTPGGVEGGAAMAMADFQFFPGVNSEESPAADMTLDTAVQELNFTEMRIQYRSELYDQQVAIEWTASLPVADAQDKLAVSLYPFLGAGYDQDYMQAFERAGSSRRPLLAVLSETPVILLLRERFVNTWVLKKDLEDDLSTNSEGSTMLPRRMLARRLLAASDQLAQVVVLTADEYGDFSSERAALTLYTETGANAAMDRTVSGFMQFLQDCLDQHHQHNQADI